MHWAWRTDGFATNHASLQSLPGPAVQEQCATQRRSVAWKSTALGEATDSHSMIGRRARRILQKHTKLNCPLDGPVPFAIVSTSAHSPQDATKYSTKWGPVFSVSPASHALANKTPTMIKSTAATRPTNQLFSFLLNSSSYSQFSKSQGPVNIQKLQRPF